MIISRFDSVIVAKLPFQPFSLLANITHRGLPGDDMTDCGMMFIFILGSIVFRQNIQRIFGWKTDSSNAPSLFDIPNDQ